jgi:uncharacterized protein (TIGR02611 family)
MTAPNAAPRRTFSAVRGYVRRLPGGALAWRIMISILGGAIIIVGIILLPLPGPGWLIIFLGLGLWSTEFEWAARLLRFARARVQAWTRWVLTKPRWVQLVIGALGLAFTGAIVVASWWLLYR